MHVTAEIDLTAGEWGCHFHVHASGVFPPQSTFVHSLPFWVMGQNGTDRLNGVGTNFGVRGRRSEARRPRAGMGFLGRGQPAPPHQLGGLQERCKLLHLQRGPAAEGFSCILSRQIAFPSISVRIAYTLHG